MNKMKLGFLAITLTVAASAQAMMTPKGAGAVTNPKVEGFTVKFFSMAEDEGKDAIASCTGIFISSRALLTAAHCLPRAPEVPQPFLFARYKSGAIVKVDSELEIYQDVPGTQVRYERNPNYNRVDKSDASGDLGVVRFSKDVFNGEPARVVSQEELDSGLVENPNAAFYVVGTGGRQFFRFDPLKQAKQYLNEFIGEIKGAILLLEHFQESSVFSMKHRGYKVCKGDSGGPVIVLSQNKLRVIAVTSSGVGDKGGFFLQGDFCINNEFNAAGLTGANLHWLKEALQ